MSSNEPDPVPGPSHVEDPKSSASDPTVFKKVNFDSETSDEDSHSQMKERKQSMVGTPGYVSQLLQELDDVIDIDSKEEPAKPIRKQTLAERRASVKATEEDLKQYFREIAKEPKKSAEEMKKRSSQQLKKSFSLLKLQALSSREKMEESQSLSQVTPSESQSGSGWKPFDVLEEHVGVKTERSWVGTYVVGKDYWSPEEKLGKVEDYKTVKCSIDDEKTPWYDMPLQKPSQKDSTFFTRKTKSLGKIEALRLEMEESYEQMRQQRVQTAARARKSQKEQEEWTDDFKHCFREVARSGEYSHGGTHISMVDADKWLEKVGILDHEHLTLIHTGLCFMASGGSRHRGLSFIEFTHFLRMISHTTGIRLKELVGILRASQRKASDFNTDPSSAPALKRR